MGFLRRRLKACVRLPAMFGYSIDNNLWPKFKYLVDKMERSVEELKFPQYFGFSLEKRIVPRHLHLKERKVQIPLNIMLLWSDQKVLCQLEIKFGMVLYDSLLLGLLNLWSVFY